MTRRALETGADASAAGVATGKSDADGVAADATKVSMACPGIVVSGATGGGLVCTAFVLVFVMDEFLVKISG